MKITLLHPSRGRAEKANKTFETWYRLASGKIEIEHIISIDMSDPQSANYIELFSKNGITKIIAEENDSVVMATNRAAKYAQGDILIYLSDDFLAPEVWDLKVSERFHVKENELFDTPLLIKVDDCLQLFHVPVLTIPIMNNHLYKKLGYFWHPGYKSMFVDEDLYWTVRDNKWMMLCEDLKFHHEHHNLGKCENDDTYKQSEKNWDTGKAFYAQRKEAGFPLI